MKRKKKERKSNLFLDFCHCIQSIPERSSQFHYPSGQTHSVLYVNIYTVLWNPPRAADNAEPELESAFNWMSVHITLVEYICLMLPVLDEGSRKKNKIPN